jgi:hypothetical protein
LDWTGKGTETAHSGTFHARGHGLHLPDSPVIPFDAEFEGDYSPGTIFFRQFNLSNKHAAFNAFVTIAKDYFQLQTLRLDLNGKPKLHGNIFLPLSLSKLRPPANWLAALGEDPNFDLDLTLDPTDLLELASGVTTQPKMSGRASGNLKVHGRPPSLEGRSAIHLGDFVFGNEPRIAADVEIQATRGTVNLKATATARGSDPVNLEASVPLKLEKRPSGYVLDPDGPLSATLNFPAIVLSKLPLFVSRRMFVDGILSGRLAISDSLHHPQVRGAAHLINGKLLGGASLSTSITLGGQAATIDFAQVAQKNVRLAARGEIDFRDLSSITMKVFPSTPVIALTHLDPGDCISEIELFPSGATNLHFLEGRFRERINEIDFHGDLTAPGWTISLSEKLPVDPLETLLRAGSSRTFPICQPQPSGKTLTLGVERPFP